MTERPHSVMVVRGPVEMHAPRPYTCNEEVTNDMDKTMLGNIPGAPNISGLGFRGLLDQHDYAGLSAVRAGSVQHDRIDVQSPREGLPTAADLAHALPLNEM